MSFLTTTTHNVAWILKRYMFDEIELSAPFQRNPVWTVKQQSYLIDTILRGYPIPELYMQEYTDAEGNDVYTVVDGQQRLRACVEYTQGAFPINGEDSPEWSGMCFDDLSEEDKKKIFNYNFVVRVLPDMPEIELRSMFQRLNRNVVALNAQELRHATYWGEFIACVENLADDDRWPLMGIFTANDVRRMLDVEFISELAIGYLHGIQNKKETLDNWYQAYEQEFEQRSDLESTFNIVLGEICRCIPGLGEMRWRKKSDFYTLFLLFSERRNLLPLSRDQRMEMKALLGLFASEVNRFLRAPDENDDVRSEAKRYAAAVERAASDLANRRIRRDEFGRLMDEALESVA